MTPLRVVVLLALFLVLLASMAAWGFRFAMEHAPEYRQPLVERLEKELHSTVEVGVLDLGWEGFGPALELHGLKLQGKNAEPFAVQMLRIGFSLWDLVRGVFTPRRVTVEGLTLSVVKSGEGWHLESLPQSKSDGEQGAAAEAFADLSRVRLRNAEIRFEGPEGSLAIGPLHVDEIQLFRRFGRQAVVGDLYDEHGARLHIEVSIQRGQPVDIQFIAEDWEPSHFAAIDSRLVDLTYTRLEHLQGHASRDETDPQRWQFAANIEVLQRPESEDGESLVVEGPIQGAIGPKGGQLDSPRLQVSAGGASWPRQSMWLEYRAGDQPKLRAQIGWLNLEDLWPHIHPWLSADVPVHGVAGVLSDITLDWEPGQSAPSFLAQAAGVGIQMREPEILVSGFDGELSSSANRGRVMLNSRDVFLEWPTVFSEPLLLNSLTGTVDWALQAQGLQFELPDLAYSIAGVDGVGRVTGEADGAWHTELRFMAPDVTGARVLIPNIWHERLRSWLAEAAQAGELRDGYLRLDGLRSELRHTRVDLDLAHVQLRFAPGWQDVFADTASLRIRDLELFVEAPQGRIGDVLAKNVVVSKAMREGEPLLVDADVDSRAELVFALLEDSPIGKNIEGITQALDVQGACTGHLSLVLPLQRGQPTLWSADVQLDNARVDITSWPSPLEKLRGEIQISAEGLAAESLVAEMNGWPVQIRSSRNGGNTLVHGAATVNLDQLPASWPLPKWLPSRLSGQASVVVETAVSVNGETTVSVRSDLADTAVALPPPLAKPAGQARLFDLEFEPQEGQLRIAYGDQFALNSRKIGRAGQSLAMRFGSPEVPQSPAEGIWIDGNLPPVQVEPWIDLVADLAGASRAAAGEPNFGGLSLNLSEARFAGQQWSDVGLQVVRSGDSWLLNTRSEGAQGQLLINRQANAGLAIAGQFEQLHWRLSNRQHSADTEVGGGFELPRTLPSLDLRVSRFVVNDEELGPLSLAITANEHGYLIDELSIGPDLAPALKVSGAVQNPNARSGATELRAEGGVPAPQVRGVTLAQKEAPASSYLEFQLQTNDGQPWLRALAYEKQLEAGAVEASGVLRWSTPEQLRQLAVDGDVQFRFQKGRLLSVEPGAGRLLGLLSMTSLPQRFLLDFSDVTDSGLGFDSLTGSYLIDGGLARTSNLKISTPSVRVEAVGEVDLPQRRQDQVVKILPGISHGFTAAATVLGGPAVGLFLLFAQELLDKPLDQVGQLAYRIRGPLDNPEIEPLQ